jgi:hypothetical protein
MEFVTQQTDFDFVTLTGEHRRIKLKPGSLAFTYCQVPIVFSIGDKNRATVTWKNGTQQESENLSLDTETSRSIFQRLDEVAQITVELHFA